MNVGDNQQHTILNGDVVSILSNHIASESVDLIFIDPPYNIIYVIKLVTSTQSMPYFDIYLRKKLTILSRIIWHYDSSGVKATKYFGSMYEPILHCVKDKKIIFLMQMISKLKQKRAHNVN